MPGEHESAVPWRQQGTSLSWGHQPREGLSRSALGQPHLQPWGTLGATISQRSEAVPECPKEAAGAGEGSAGAPEEG